MEIPNFGKPASVLFIFIPGVFVLLNILFGLYFFITHIDSSPNSNINIKLEFLKPITIDIINSINLALLGFLFFVCFGYLVGVVLSLIRCDFADYISNKYWQLEIGIRKTLLHNNNDTNFEKLITKKKNNQFPYYEYIIEEYKSYNEFVLFYEELINILHELETLDEDEKPTLTQRNFNNLKTTLLYINKDLFLECFNVESLNRYVTSILYGILFSLIFLLIITLITYFEINKISYSILLMLFIITFYLILLLLIIRNYRLSRIREVELVLNAIFTIRKDCIAIYKKESSQGTKFVNPNF